MNVASFNAFFFLGRYSFKNFVLVRTFVQFVWSLASLCLLNYSFLIFIIQLDFSEPFILMGFVQKKTVNSIKNFSLFYFL